MPLPKPANTDMANSTTAYGRWAAVALAIIGLATALYQVVVDNTPKGEAAVIEGYKPWEKAVVAAAEDMPVQDGGRIKPLSTYAGFTMLSLHGARSMKVDDGKGNEYKLKPIHWLLDTLLRPNVAVELPTFRVDNSAAIEAIGLEPKGRRDRYSYADLQAGREKLGELFRSYQQVDADDRDALQNQVITLGANIMAYEGLLGYFTFARNGVTLVGSGNASSPDKRADTSAIMATAPMIRQQVRESGLDRTRMGELLQQIVNLANFSKFGIFLIPPADEKDSQWLSAGNVIMETMDGTAADPELMIEDIRVLERIARLGYSMDAELEEAINEANKRFANRAKSRGEAKRVSLEAAYYHVNWFLYAMVWFLIGTLGAFAMWITGKSGAGRLFWWITLLSTAAGVSYCIIAIVKRCIIMQRPPVGNLYDTIIFIATAIVLISLLIEWLTRRRYALGLAPIIGTGLIILARRFELGDGSDHMDPLVAVLDSNYWLTTHVITITLGYSAGLLSAFLSAVYVLIRGLRLAESNKDLIRQLTRTVYGMICFTLFLSLVGTVLGGIWANDSWGRFWGWDPKENGALLIVLWTLAILHARLGGYLREWGLHLASLFTAIIVTFSWWHVNFLGVGLHNYGFTAGKSTIWAFYAAICVFILFGAIAWIIEKVQKSQTSKPPPVPHGDPVRSSST